MMKEFDLVVIGSGPAGEKAAVKAAYFGNRVALVEKEPRFGGAGVQTGTIPSKTLKESALHFSGVYEKGIYGLDFNFSHQATIEDFMFRKNVVSKAIGNEVQENLQRHGVEVFSGEAQFSSPHDLRILLKKNAERVINGKYFLIATGSYPFHPPHIPFDGQRLHDSNTILNIKDFPTTLLVVGAGVIACEYATIFAAMGVKVFLINNRSTVLNFADTEISDALITVMKTAGITLINNTDVAQVRVPSSTKQPLQIELTNGGQLKTDMFLFAAGRNGNTKALRLINAGIVVGKRELIPVNENFQTSVSHIYAAGDVIGFPALASTSMDQGRMAIAHMFAAGDLDTIAKVFPFGIYTIPEISMVGITEKEARDAGNDYCVGRSYYKDISRARIQTDKNIGFMKLLYDKHSRVVLGVHIIGQLATEIIHYGLTLVKDQRTVHDIISTVFNYPTLHDLYKYAAYDGLGNEAGHKLK
jgi:NAD(P) transhydrogenase